MTTPTHPLSPAEAAALIRWCSDAPLPQGHPDYDLVRAALAKLKEAARDR